MASKELVGLMRAPRPLWIGKGCGWMVHQRLEHPPGFFDRVLPGEQGVVADECVV
jgi:hypothetical protein